MSRYIAEHRFKPMTPTDYSAFPDTPVGCLIAYTSLGTLIYDPNADRVTEAEGTDAKRVWVRPDAQDPPNMRVWKALNDVLRTDEREIGFGAARAIFEEALDNARRIANRIVPPKLTEPTDWDKLRELLSRMGTDEIAAALNHVLGPDNLEVLRDKLDK